MQEVTKRKDTREKQKEAASKSNENQLHYVYGCQTILTIILFLYSNTNQVILTRHLMILMMKI